MKTIYACFSTNILHDGHLNLICQAKKYGKFIAGVVSDEVMVKYDKFPIKSLQERMEMLIEAGADEVIVQNDPYYTNILERIHPDYVIHGDNWCTKKYLVSVRQSVIEQLKCWGGKLIEIPYTQNEHVKKLDRDYYELLAMPEYRRKRLSKLLDLRKIVKAIEVHNGITGLIAEKTIVENEGEIDQFDAMWISSLCDSTAKGKPDIELVDMSSRIQTVEEVMDVTTKPIILDCDTGGLTEHFIHNVRTLERIGVSAVIIEDKIGLKRNSLYGTAVKQEQDNIENFCNKIRMGKEALRTKEFMIIARIESLILEAGMEDAIKRARAYVQAGADAIMIHSRKKEPDEIFEFANKFRNENIVTPLVIVPTTFNHVTEKEFVEHQINIVIYANQLTRSGFPAMQKAAESILANHRAKEADGMCMSIKEILSLIPE